MYAVEPVSAAVDIAKRSSNPSTWSSVRRGARRVERMVFAVWNLRASLLKKRSMEVSLARAEPFGFRESNERYRWPGHPAFAAPQFSAKTRAGFPNEFSIFFRAESCARRRIYRFAPSRETINHWGSCVNRPKRRRGHCCCAHLAHRSP